MTDAELYTLIQGDTQAAALYADGNDEGCALRCSAIAPIIRKPVAAATLRKELAKLGKWGGLQRVANNFERSPDMFRSACRAGESDIGGCGGRKKSGGR